MTPKITLIGFRVLKGRMGQVVSQYDLKSSGLSALELETKIKVTLRLLDDDPTVRVVRVYRWQSESGYTIESTLWSKV